jgi:hypothetical protein
MGASGFCSAGILPAFFEFGFKWDRLQPVVLRSSGAIATRVRISTKERNALG